MNRSDAIDVIARLQAIWSDRWSPARTDEWIDALESCQERAAFSAVLRFRSSHDKCPSIAEFLATARPPSSPRRDGHSLACMCGGSGWVTVTEHNDRESWEAFTRCPDGPSTTFVEPDAEFDPVASAAAWETFNALAATAEKPAEVAQACFAAAAAYRNAERKTLL